jgi:hypothetical protein
LQITCEERATRAYVVRRLGYTKAAGIFGVSLDTLVAQAGTLPWVRGGNRLLKPAAVRAEYEARRADGEAATLIVESIAARCSCTPRTVWRSLQRTPWRHAPSETEPPSSDQQ